MIARSDTTKSSAGMLRGTERDRGAWFDALDAWGAAGRPYQEISAWLTGEQGISSWWAQKLIVEYEEARGLRQPGVRRDGTFTVGATKSVAVPVERLFAAAVDPGLRERWLPDAVLHERTIDPIRLARFDWDDGSTRISVGFEATGASRSQIAVEHVRLADAKAAAESKAFWRERLTVLKAFLEHGEDA